MPVVGRCAPLQLLSLQSLGSQTVEGTGSFSSLGLPVGLLVSLDQQTGVPGCFGSCRHRVGRKMDLSLWLPALGPRTPCSETSFQKCVDLIKCGSEPGLSPVRRLSWAAQKRQAPGVHPGPPGLASPPPALPRPQPRVSSGRS